MDRSATGTATTLLGPGDPDPVEVLRPEGGAVLFLTCEHAGRAIPRRLGTLGLDERHLERHIAWDIGAAGVARRLSAALDATLVLQRYSRLVVDCNRAPGAHDFVVTLSEDTGIPGNVDVPEGERLAREIEIFRPYHDTIRSLLDERSAVAGRHRVERLVGLLQQRATEGVVGLLEVPRTAGHGVAQAAHRFEKGVEGVGQGASPHGVGARIIAEPGQVESMHGTCA